MLKRIYGVLDRIRSISIVAILAFIIGLCTVQIILRYFTGSGLRPFAWGDELIRLCSIWVAFLAASLGAKEEAHLCVTIFIKKFFPPKVMVIVEKTANVIVIAVLCYLTYYGAVRMLANIQTSLQNINISIAWFHAAIPVGCTFLVIDYTLILIFGRHPFSNKLLYQEDDLNKKAIASTEKINTY